MTDEDFQKFVAALGGNYQEILNKLEVLQTNKAK